MLAYREFFSHQAWQCPHLSDQAFQLHVVCLQPLRHVIHLMLNPSLDQHALELTPHVYEANT